MKKLISSLKRIRIGQILTVFLAGLLVFVSTACGSGGGLQARAQTADQVKEEVPEGTAASSYKGGMNEFPDTDPRRDTSEAGSKASSLVEAAEQNITKDYQVNAPAVGEKVQQATEDVGDAAKGLAKDVSKGTQRGLETIKGNTQSAAKGVQRAAEKVPGQVSGS